MKPKLKKGQMVLCVCHEWCELGYQVAQWDGKRFSYPGEPNNNFDNCVTGYLPMNQYGKPSKGPFIQYKDGDNEMFR